MIEHNIPPPDSHCGQFRAMLTQMQPGDSFTIDTRSQLNLCYLCAAQIGVRIKTQIQAKGGWRVWKLNAKVSDRGANNQKLYDQENQS